MSNSRYTLIALLVTISLMIGGCKYEVSTNTAENQIEPTGSKPSETMDSDRRSEPPNSLNRSQSSETKPPVSNVDASTESTPAIETDDADQNDQEPEKEQPDEPATAGQVIPVNEVPGQEKQTIKVGDNWKRLGKEHEIWIDLKNKQIMAAGHICLRQGPLEVFICPRRTKEHESVISLNATALQVHTALLALGAEPGHPVRWPFGDEQTEYEPATGPVIKIRVKWRDGENIIEKRGQEMVRDFKTRQPLKQDWVFGGSQFYEDPHSKVRVYYGDSGELVCLSNFSTATMDLPIESSSSNDDLMYECNPDVVPPLGTKVYVVFEPVLESTTTPSKEQLDSKIEKDNKNEEGNKKKEPGNKDGGD